MNTQNKNAVYLGLCMIFLLFVLYSMNWLGEISEVVHDGSVGEIVRNRFLIFVTLCVVLYTNRHKEGK